MPNGKQAVARFRHLLSDDSSDLEALDAAVEGLGGGGAYQAAQHLVTRRRGPAEAQAVMRALILDAYQPHLMQVAREGMEPNVDDRYCEDAEADTDGWTVPQPIDGIARLLAAQPQAAPGPIVTTNIDPLVEIALRKHDVQVPVLHIHGYWRNNETLQEVQSETYRAQLTDTLERALAGRTVVVLGCGGWDGDLAQALTEVLMRHRNGDLELLWALHESDDAELAIRYADLVETFQRVPGRVSFFRGVDAGALIADVIAEPASTDSRATEVAADFSAPLPNWTAISPRVLADERFQATHDEAVAYFDGRAPTWRHVLTASVPPRRQAIELTDLITGDERGGPYLYRVSGPAGVGKSTVMLQVAARIAAKDGWHVLWSERSAPIDARAIADLDPEINWLLVVDDVDELVKVIFEALREAGHSAGHVRLLIATRTLDWDEIRGDKIEWSRVASNTTVELEGLSDGDARVIVDGWAREGQAGLLRLSELDSDERAQELQRTVATVARGEDGALVGAVARARHGDGLREHVRAALARLEGIPGRGGGTLLRPFLVIAAAHGENLLTLPPAVPAKAAGLDEPADAHELFWRLGREGVASFTTRSVLARHRALAELSLELMPEFGVSPGEVYYDLIHATLRCRQDDVYIPDMARILYLPKQMPDADAASRAAEALTELEPDRFSFWTTRCGCLRRAGRVDEALRVAAEGFSRWGREEGGGSDSPRSLLANWAVCFGINGKPAANAYLSMVSLADGFGPVGLNAETMSAALYVVAVGSERLGDEGRPAMQAASYLWRRLPVGSTGAEPRIISAMRAISVPPEMTLDSSLDALTSSAGPIWNRLEVELPANVPTPPLAFSTIESLLR